MSLFDDLKVSLPIVQAPMAGVSTPALAAAVSNAGALGSIGVGAVNAQQARTMMGEARSLTAHPFNVNVFVHQPAELDEQFGSAWLGALTPVVRDLDAEPPTRLRAIYKSFHQDDEMLAALLDFRPAVVSFHFGLPAPEKIAALKSAGCVLLSTATNLAEALAARDLGIDAVVAQGWEAGGLRGIFDPDERDDRLGTMALTRILAAKSGLPVIAAGGIMDGQGIRAAMDLGAIGAQLGTAFICCPESSADGAYRDALLQDSQPHTVMTQAISGSPARGLSNRFTDWGLQVGLRAPGYPMTYDAGKALFAAASRAGQTAYAAQWAGQGAPLVRSMPAANLVARLAEEMRSAA